MSGTGIAELSEAPHAKRRCWAGKKIHHRGTEDTEKDGWRFAPRKEYLGTLSSL
jgi:hypothetical protein